LLREAHGFTGRGGQSRFADFLGVRGGMLNQVELGHLSLSKAAAFRIVEKFPGVTLEWLWWGDRKGLTVEMAQKLEEATKK
jgi:transcriptional regulator with XRE-family HTH domain